MSQIAVKFENIGKQYRLGTIGTGTLSHDLNRWWHKVKGGEDPYLKIGEESSVGSTQSSVGRKKEAEEYMWALQNINLEIKEGEAIGIIGKNGAGKSTLLKILSRITSPTTGSITAYGRIASLLEVGTGFHPEMTGRENIFMNGSIMGMTRREIRSKFDEIVDFAGVEKFIDTPVKRYSSGMMVRLGFAVAAHLEPEILVVDEVLAVGDAAFQNKCLGKMEDITKSKGRTILFVSHNMAAVERLCQRSVVLEDGMIGFQGEVGEGVAWYLNRSRPEGSKIISGIEQLNPEFHIDEITLNGSPLNQVPLNADQPVLNVSVKGRLSEPKRVALEVRLFDNKGTLLAFYSPGHLHGQLYDLKQGSFEITESIIFPGNITMGEYYLDIDLTHPNVEYYMRIPKHVKLMVTGISGTTGLELKYEQCGFLMLK